MGIGGGNVAGKKLGALAARDSSNTISRQEVKDAMNKFAADELSVLRSTFKDLAARGKTGKDVDKATFLKVFPLPGLLGERLFTMFDRNETGVIDYDEFICGMAIWCRGSLDSRMRFLFRMYDLSGDGHVAKADLRTLLNHLPSAVVRTMDKGVLDAEQEGDLHTNAVENLVRRAFQECDLDRDGKLSYDSFCLWLHKTPEMLQFLSSVFPYGLETATRTSPTSAAAAAASSVGRQRASIDTPASVGKGRSNSDKTSTSPGPSMFLLEGHFGSSGQEAPPRNLSMQAVHQPTPMMRIRSAGAVEDSSNWAGIPVERIRSAPSPPRVVAEAVDAPPETPNLPQVALSGGTGIRVSTAATPAEEHENPFAANLDLARVTNNETKTTHVDTSTESMRRSSIASAPAGPASRYEEFYSNAYNHPSDTEAQYVTDQTFEEYKRMKHLNLMSNLPLNPGINPYFAKDADFGNATNEIEFVLACEHCNSVIAFDQHTGAPLASKVNSPVAQASSAGWSLQCHYAQDSPWLKELRHNLHHEEEQNRRLSNSFASVTAQPGDPKTPMVSYRRDTANSDASQFELPPTGEVFDNVAPSDSTGMFQSKSDNGDNNGNSSNVVSPGHSGSAETPSLSLSETDSASPENRNKASQPHTSFPIEPSSKSQTTLNKDTTKSPPTSRTVRSDSEQSDRDSVHANQKQASPAGELLDRQAHSFSRRLLLIPPHMRLISEQNDEDSESHISSVASQTADVPVSDGHTPQPVEPLDLGESDQNGLRQIGHDRTYSSENELENVDTLRSPGLYSSMVRPRTPSGTMSLTSEDYNRFNTSIDSSGSDTDSTASSGTRSVSVIQDDVDTDDDNGNRLSQDLARSAVIDGLENASDDTFRPRLHGDRRKAYNSRRYKSTPSRNAHGKGVEGLWKSQRRHNRDRGSSDYDIPNSLSKQSKSHHDSATSTAVKEALFATASVIFHADGRAVTESLLSRCDSCGAPHTKLKWHHVTEWRQAAAGRFAQEFLTHLKTLGLCIRPVMQSSIMEQNPNKTLEQCDKEHISDKTQPDERLVKSDGTHTNESKKSMDNASISAHSQADIATGAGASKAIASDNTDTDNDVKTHKSDSNISSSSEVDVSALSHTANAALALGLGSIGDQIAQSSSLSNTALATTLAITAAKEAARMWTLSQSSPSIPIAQQSGSTWPAPNHWHIPSHHMLFFGNEGASEQMLSQANQYAPNTVAPNAEYDASQTQKQRLPLSQFPPGGNLNYQEVYQDPLYAYTQQIATEPGSKLRDIGRKLFSRPRASSEEGLGSANDFANHVGHPHHSFSLRRLFRSGRTSMDEPRRNDHFLRRGSLDDTTSNVNTGGIVQNRARGRSRDYPGVPGAGRLRQIVYPRMTEGRHLGNSDKTLRIQATGLSTESRSRSQSASSAPDTPTAGSSDAHARYRVQDNSTRYQQRNMVPIPYGRPVQPSNLRIPNSIPSTYDPNTQRPSNDNSSMAVHGPYHVWHGSATMGHTASRREGAAAYHYPAMPQCWVLPNPDVDHPQNLLTNSPGSRRSVSMDESEDFSPAQKNRRQLLHPHGVNSSRHIPSSPVLTATLVATGHVKPPNITRPSMSNGSMNQPPSLVGSGVTSGLSGGYPSETGTNISHSYTSDACSNIPPSVQDKSVTIPNTGTTKAQTTTRERNATDQTIYQTNYPKLSERTTYLNGNETTNKEDDSLTSPNKTDDVPKSHMRLGAGAARSLVLHGCDMLEKEGYLYKVGARFRQFTKRWYYLAQNFLYWYSKQKNTTPRGVLFLEDSYVKSVDDQVAKGYWGLSIHTSSAHGERTKVLYTKTRRERDEWLQVLKSACRAEPFEVAYKLGKNIGRGRFSRVAEAISNATGKKYAVKIINKDELNEDEKELLRTEIAILKLVNHPHIIRLDNVYETSSTLYIVMELLPGGELFDRIVGRSRFREDEARELVKPLVDAVAYLHSLGIAHRDLKPENILTGDTLHDLKIADFGLSKLIHPNEKMSKPCGTLSYVAPEVLTGNGYGKQADLWSVGVIVYLVVRGKLPFDGRSKEEVATRTVTERLDFRHHVWKDWSGDGLEFVQKLLERDPSRRLTARQALRHPWLRSAAMKKHVDISSTSTTTTTDTTTLTTSATTAMTTETRTSTTSATASGTTTTASATATKE